MFFKGNYGFKFYFPKNHFSGISLENKIWRQIKSKPKFKLDLFSISTLTHELYLIFRLKILNRANQFRKIPNIRFFITFYIWKICISLIINWLKWKTVFTIGISVKFWVRMNFEIFILKISVFFENFPGVIKFSILYKIPLKSLFVFKKLFCWITS